MTAGLDNAQNVFLPPFCSRLCARFQKKLLSPSSKGAAELLLKTGHPRQREHSPNSSKDSTFPPFFTQQHNEYPLEKRTSLFGPEKKRFDEALRPRLGPVPGIQHSLHRWPKSGEVGSLGYWGGSTAGAPTPMCFEQHTRSNNMKEHESTTRLVIRVHHTLVGTPDGDS